MSTNDTINTNLFRSTQNEMPHLSTNVNNATVLMTNNKTNENTQYEESESGKKRKLKSKAWNHY